VRRAGSGVEGEERSSSRSVPGGGCVGAREGEATACAAPVPVRSVLAGAGPGWGPAIGIARAGTMGSVKLSFSA